MSYHDYYSNDLQGAADAEKYRHEAEDDDDTPTLADCAEADEMTDEERQRDQEAQDWEDTMDSLRYDFR
jgi:hypothetical protein